MLLIITVASLALRLVGLGFQLPQFVPVDALVLASEVEVLRHHGDPSYRLHPNLYPQLIPALSLLVPLTVDEKVPPASLAKHLERARAPYMRVAYVIAILSVLCILLTYLIARYFLERGPALLAASLVATSVLHLWFSQEPRPHSGAVAFTLLAVLASLRLARKPAFSSFLLAGLAVGSAIAALQSGIATLLPLGAAWLVRMKRPRSSSWWLIASLLLAALIAWSLYPSMAGTPRAQHVGTGEFIAIHGSTLVLMGHGISIAGFNGGGFPIVIGALALYDPLIAGCAFLGIVIYGMRRFRRTPEGPRRSLLVALAYLLPYGLTISLYRLSAQRFVIPLIPFLSILAAYGLSSAVEWATARGRVLKGLVVTSVVAILLTQGAAATKLSWIRSRPDTAIEAAEWLQAHLPTRNDRVLVTPGVDLPLMRTRDAIARSRDMHPNPNQRWFAYQLSKVADEDQSTERFNLLTIPAATPEDRERLMQDPSGYLRSLGVQWVAIELHRTWDWKGVAKLHDALSQVGHLAVRFSPDRVGTWGEVPIAHQGFDPNPFPVWWFWRVLEARNTGMILEIWDLRQTQ